jgi:ubiquinone/menaquinone biosynthesis C-methylase UbiE
MESKGQNISVWSEFWEKHTPETEINIWEFYLVRHWIMKYTPRFGKIIEAGCGLGRVVFYLRELGIDIEGLDFDKDLINNLNIWSQQNNNNAKFIYGDVTNLPYPDNSVSGYISLGVIEHFIEGPQKPLKEVYRVLRPGGIALITTPNVSFSTLYHKLSSKIRNIIKFLIGRKIIKLDFFQYWYSPRRLKKFIEESGMKVTNFKGGDLLYAFYEMDIKIKENSFPVKLADKFENSFLSKFGAQSYTVSVKAAPLMYCYLCGDLNAGDGSLKYYQVPICDKCSVSTLSCFYKIGTMPKFHSNYEINPEKSKASKATCFYCKRNFTSSLLFENYGLSVDVCSDCLQNYKINIEFSNQYLKPVWRRRN